MSKYTISMAGSSAYQKAIAFAGALAINNHDIKKIILVTPGKNHGFFADIFDQKTIKNLETGVSIPDSPAKMKSTSRQSYSGTLTPDEVVVTFGLDANDVLLLEEKSNSIIDIIAVHPAVSLLHKWIQTWNPIDIATYQPILSTLSLPSCIVQEAFQRLSSVVDTNVSNFIATDDERTKTYVRALHRYEPSQMNPINIFSYLRRDLKWTVGAANYVETLVDKLNQGQTFKGGEKTGMRERYKKWAAQCP